MAEFKELEYGPLKGFAAKGKAARLESKPGWFIGPKGQGLDIAEVHCTASQNPAEQEAYARLFVAAPKLLAMLKLFVEPATVREICNREEWAKELIAQVEGGAK